jgi:hypothetical protein
MRSNKNLIWIVTAVVLFAALWLSGRLLVTAAYHGDAGNLLNSIISDRSAHPLDEYLADYNRMFMMRAVPVALLALILVTMRKTLVPLPLRLYTTIRNNRPAITAAISLAFLSCIAGAWFAWSGAGIYQHWLKGTFNAVSAVYQDSFRKRPLLGESDTWVHQDKRPLQGLGTYIPGLAQDGVTLVFGMQQAWLVDMDGTLLHSWAVDYDSLQSDRKLIPRSYPETYIYWHQARLYPNGDLLVMIDQFDKSPSGLAMMKIDRDSKVLWVYPHHVHHDFSLDEQGNIYAIDQKIRNDPVAGLNLETPYLDDGLLKLSPDGEPLDRISIIDAFAGTDFADFFNGNSSYRQGDYLHTNDVDMLATGQLGSASTSVLLSFNGLSAIAVMDLDTRKITRAWAGYWHHQHDPDLLDNGNIILFDNLGAWSPGQNARVIEFNPDTYEIVWEYPGKTGQHLFSTYRGREQVQPNGNVLISEFESGRLIEVTREGQLVWEYSCPFRSAINPEYVCNFVAGRRYRSDELDFVFNAGRTE